MEPNVPTNYESKYSKDKLTITNTYISPKTDNLIGEKIWDKVPDKIVKPTVKLELWRKTSEDGKPEKAVEEAKVLDAKNQADFGKQDETDKDGNEYIYFVREVDENGNKFSHKNYSSKVERLKVTNTYRESSQPITAKKVWKDGLGDDAKRPTIYFKLYRKIEDGKEQAVDGVDVKQLSNGTTEVTWDNQDIADDEGNKYTYSVKEVDDKGKDFTPEGYTATYSEDGLTVTNTKDTVVPPTSETKKITVKATKTWSGGNPDDYTTVRLQLKRTSANDPSVEEIVPNEYVSQKDGSTIYYEWKDLPSKDSDGNNYTYEVVESDAVKSIYTVDKNKYLSVVEKDDKNTNYETIAFKISNTYQKPQDPKNIVAYKKWVGVPEGESPPKIKFQLQRKTEGGEFDDVDGEVRDVVDQPDELGFIKVQFGPQEADDGKGNSYTYRVRELNGDGASFKDDDYYKHEVINNLNVINTYIKKTPEPEPTPTPTPTPEDTPKVPETPEIPEEPETPEEPEEPEIPEKPEEPETPETPEKPEEKIPEKPEKEKPPVKTDTKKKSDQTGTKFVKQMEQTGTKIVSNVKHFLNPTTGIITNYEIYIGLMAASSVGLFFTRDKKNEDEE